LHWDIAGALRRAEFFGGEARIDGVENGELGLFD